MHPNSTYLGTQDKNLGKSLEPLDTWREELGQKYFPESPQIFWVLHSLQGSGNYLWVLLKDHRNVGHAFWYHVKVLSSQLHPTLCDPMEYNLLGSSVYGIFQARILEWVAISFSRESSWPRYQTQVSCIAGRFFTIWATREVHLYLYQDLYPFASISVRFLEVELGSLDQNAVHI